MPAPRLYVIDGMSQFYRAYYAIRRLTNREGLPTGAVFGFTSMLRKLVEEEKPDYLAVAMDLPGPTVRHEQFPDYKATRPPMPKDLSRQIPYLHRVCRVFRVPMLSHPGYEADDIIATVTRQASETGLEVVIVTVDKDLFQIVDSGVTILDTRTMTRFDPAKVEKKFGVRPHQLGDLLSLVGDTSDNIPGAKGIGQKGAALLLRSYGDLDNLLAHRDEVRRKTYRESLQQNEAVVRQSRELVTMYDRIPLDLDLETLRIGEPDPAEARKLFLELNFTRLLEEFLPEPETAGGEYERFESSSQLDALLTRLEGAEAGLALLPGAKGEPVRGVGVSMGQGQGIHLGGDLLEDAPDRLLSLLNRPKRWIIHDLKPLLMLAGSRGWQLKSEFADTRLMAYLLTPNQNDFSLKRLAIQRLQTRLSESEAGLFPDEEELLARSADLTLRLFGVLEVEVRTHGLEDLLVDMEIPLVQVLADMEAAGVKVDREMLQDMSRQMGREIQVLADRITELAGEKFNLNSPKQLGTILFEKLGLPPPKKTPKAKHFSTGVEVLQRLAGEHEIAGRVLEYREQTKLKNTYLDALPGLVDPDSGRIHTSYNQMVAATGRLSSSNPNLQNIPIKTDLGRQIRRAFVAEEGYRLLAADYSQIELQSHGPPLGGSGSGGGLPPGRGHPRADRRRSPGRAHRSESPGTAPLRQDHQFRDPLRGQRLRPGPESGDRTVGGQASHRRVLRTLPGRQALVGSDARRGLRDGLRPNPFRSYPPDSGAQEQELEPQELRRADRHQRPHPGHGRGPDQEGHDLDPPVPFPKRALQPAHPSGSRRAGGGGAGSGDGGSPGTDPGKHGRGGFPASAAEGGHGHGAILV